jgi:hypothetical protein
MGPTATQPLYVQGNDHTTRRRHWGGGPIYVKPRNEMHVTHRKKTKKIAWRVRGSKIRAQTSNNKPFSLSGRERRDLFFWISVV